jgi:hypothetical protein
MVLVDESIKSFTSVYMFWDKGSGGICMAPTNIEMEKINKPFNSKNTPFSKKISPNQVRCGEWESIIKNIISPDLYDLMD